MMRLYALAVDPTATRNMLLPVSQHASDVPGIEIVLGLAMKGGYSSLKRLRTLTKKSAIETMPKMPKSDPRSAPPQ